MTSFLPIFQTQTHAKGLPRERNELLSLLSPQHTILYALGTEDQQDLKISGMGEACKACISHRHIYVNIVFNFFFSISLAL